MKDYLKIALILFLLLSVHSIYGQPPPPDGGGGPGTTPDVLPINILVYPFLLIGAYLGYCFTKNSSK